ncbi:hypothetical protein [Paraburkholderia solisilvae]|uniref:hypothetical protein n=1 Tax=Paraburkholderia solisilvae TaxID=624376 RepID=UPI0015815B0F|nr:hypothetical protein [Paraburkholderia solisilvae]
MITTVRYSKKNKKNDQSDITCAGFPKPRVLARKDINRVFIIRIHRRCVRQSDMRFRIHAFTTLSEATADGSEKLLSAFRKLLQPRRASTHRRIEVDAPPCDARTQRLRGACTSTHARPP